MITSLLKNLDLMSFEQLEVLPFIYNEGKKLAKEHPDVAVTLTGAHLEELYEIKDSMTIDDLPDSLVTLFEASDSWIFMELFCKEIIALPHGDYYTKVGQVYFCIFLFGILAESVPARLSNK